MKTRKPFTKIVNFITPGVVGVLILGHGQNNHMMLMNVMFEQSTSPDTEKIELNAYLKRPKSCLLHSLISYLLRQGSWL